MPPTYTDTLIEELEQLEHVITVSVMRGASIKPPGDVVTVHALNRGADQVMRLADAARKQGQVSISTSELSSIVDPEHERKVANDVDEALWEEAETGLRHQSQITANYLGHDDGPRWGGRRHRPSGGVDASGNLDRGGVDHRARFRSARQDSDGPGPQALGRGEEWPDVGGRRLPGVGSLGGAGLPGTALGG